MHALYKSAKRQLVVATLVAGFVAQPVCAQIASGGDTVLFRSDAAGVRVEPQYQPTPLTIGPVQATVAASARVVADSNIFRTSQSTGDDVYVEVVPSVRLVARFGAHSATLSARGSVRRYARFKSEDRDAVELTYAALVDLGLHSAASFRSAFVRETEQRGSAGADRIDARPSQVQRLESGASVGTEIGRLRIAAAASIVQRSYDPLIRENSPAVSQSFRDTETLRVAPRLDYKLGPAAAIFAGGSASRTTSIDRSQGGLRDASGYTLIAGFRSDTEGLIVGEVGVGWRGQYYRNPEFRDVAGLTYDATIDWYPTRLVSVRVQAGQDIVNSSLRRVAGIVRRSVGATFYYDPLRSLRFVMALDRDHDDFRELQFSTKTTNVSLTARYQMGRHIDVAVFGRVTSKTSSDTRFVNGYKSVGVGIALTGTL
jgi:hypothetical protein